MLTVKSQNSLSFTNDSIIRKLLKEKLLAKHSKDKTVRIIEELGINHGSARADIAVVNGILHGYEIKSDLDTLNRLPSQINAYNSVFDRVTIVVGMSHIHEAISLIPEWWGICLVRRNSNDKLYINKIREAEMNENINIVSVARLLWREEALELLERMGIARGMRAKERTIIYKKLADNLNQDALKERVRDRLFFRANWRVDQKLHINGG